MKKESLIGKKINEWTVLYECLERRNKKIYYHCRCSCGVEKDVMGQHLKNGSSKSCGHLRNDLLSKRQFKDITGQIFGKLTVICYADTPLGGHARWLCRCECGKQKIINGKSLRTGVTKSCGCEKSYGEKKIALLLQQNNISFEKEKDFESCRYPDTNFKAKFDFYINNQYLIEYDGKQHFGIIGSGWDDEQYVKTIQRHDKYKNQWCQKNNIPLIRIPYTQYENLKIEDLLLDKSNFIIEGDE